jgi:GDP-fucose protein O-fucosyltransferase
MLPFSHPSQRSKYRSARSVRPQGNGSAAAVASTLSGGKWSRAKVLAFAGAILAVACLTMVPIMIMEGSYSTKQRVSPDHLHPNKMIGLSKAIQREAAQGKRHFTSEQEKDNVQNEFSPGEEGEALPVPIEAGQAENEADAEPSSPLVRGVNKYPLSKTPALLGAQRGHVNCDVPIDQDKIVYWSSPQGDRDQAFKSPFAPPVTEPKKEYYITFQPDRGGWNNIRMSLEILFVMAAATGRTLVLPPKIPLYLLGHGKEGARSFGNFYPLDNPALLDKVKIISMKEFVQRESHRWTGLSDVERKKMLEVSEVCLRAEGSDQSCEVLNKQLRNRGYQPKIHPQENCWIFDVDVLNADGNSGKLSDEVQLEVDQFCGGHRTPVFYDKALQTTPWIHWDAGCDTVGNKDQEHCFRLLQHFYTFIYFTDPMIDNHFKRFVRDFLHYNDDVYCAAAKVIHAVQGEADELLVPWSTWHVRRGDLQYKKVKISAEEWYENTKEVWQPGEMLYIATDERDKSFFDPIKAKGHPVRFLDDYWEVGGIGKLDTTYIGMVDTIIASHGRAFAGTWFSTFTGYINRLRGYLGKSMKDSWYSFLPRKEAMREFTFPDGNYPAREWQIGWLGIDTDEHIFVEVGVPVDDNQAKAALKLQLAAPKKLVDDKPIKFEVGS